MRFQKRLRKRRAAIEEEVFRWAWFGVLGANVSSFEGLRAVSFGC